ncbi:MAG: hypothetical protein ACJAVA_001922 [Flavobacteriaceae bacterium]|jgi:hypothetical protein
MNTWAIFWYATVFKREGLSLHPSKSLVNNIGHDSSGDNCGESTIYCSQVHDKPVVIFPDKISECYISMGRIKIFLMNKKNFFLPD